MYSHRIKIIFQNNFVLLCSDSCLYGGPKPWQQNGPHSTTVSLDSLCGGQAFEGFSFNLSPFYICVNAALWKMWAKIL